MTSFDPKRRELLKLSAVTGGALAMGDLWPASAEAAENAIAAGAKTTAVPTAVDVVLRVNGAEHRLALDARTTLLDALREHLHLERGRKRAADSASAARAPCSWTVSG